MTLSESRADAIKRLQGTAPCKMEHLLFGGGYSLTAAEGRALLRAGSAHEKEMILAKSMTDRVKAMRDDRAGLDSLI